MNSGDRSHILVTGSRSYTDRGRVVSTLRRFSLYRGPLVLMHGAHGHGPDMFAAQWADALPDTEVVAAPRPVTSKDWTVYGSAAGPRRNQGMVDEIARIAARGTFTACLAFIGPCVSAYCRRPKPHDSHGASGCADMAEVAGIWTVRLHLETEDAP